MLTPTTYRRIYRASAWYDLAIAWPFATPLTLPVLWGLLDAAQGGLGLAPLPALGVYMVLFANFFGTVVIFWSLARLRLDDPLLGRFDAVGRFVFSAWMIWALVHGASPLIAIFLAVEIAFGLVQALPVRQSPIAAR